MCISSTYYYYQHIVPLGQHFPLSVCVQIICKIVKVLYNTLNIAIIKETWLKYVEQIVGDDKSENSGERVRVLIELFRPVIPEVENFICMDLCAYSIFDENKIDYDILWRWYEYHGKLFI